MDKRLDLYLVENGFAKSRNRAKVMIKNSGVLVNGKSIKTPSYNVSDDDAVSVVGEDLQYVGRGALKLERAFDEFNINIDGFVCADIGASTGGFTQVMLNRGAKKVYAIDVGHDQLDNSLVMDSRVVNCEGTNVRDLDRDFFRENVQFMGVDLSFISLKLVMDVLYQHLDENGEIAVLIKPQFEAGKSALNKKGIVKDKKVHCNVLTDVIKHFDLSGFEIIALTYSSITGGDGNVEYLAHIKKSVASQKKSFDLKSIVDLAFTNLKN